MKIWFNFLKQFLYAAIVTADTPHLRKLLLIKCFEAASMTKIQFKQNTSEKLDYQYCCIALLWKFLEIKLKSRTEQKNMTAIARSSARRKVSLFQKSISWYLRVGMCLEENYSDSPSNEYSRPLLGRVRVSATSKYGLKIRWRAKKKKSSCP